MLPQRKDIYNRHPEFVGISGMLEKLKETHCILKNSLAKGDYSTARNPDFAIWCCPAGCESSKFGFKYTVYDEAHYLEKRAFSLYAETFELLLAAYGFDIWSGCFSIDVPSIDLHSITSEFIFHVSKSPILFAKFPIEKFVGGLMDCGFDYCINGVNENDYWLNKRDEMHHTDRIKVELFTNDVLVRRVRYGDKLIWAGNVYTLDILEYKRKLEKVYVQDDYFKLYLIRDIYGEYWLRKYESNDHSYYISKDYYHLKEGDCWDETSADLLITGNVIDNLPSFHINESKGYSFFSLYEGVSEEFRDKRRIEDELMLLKRLNGISPNVL